MSAPIPTGYLRAVCLGCPPRNTLHEFTTTTGRDQWAQAHIAATGHRCALIPAERAPADHPRAARDTDPLGGAG